MDPVSFALLVTTNILGGSSYAATTYALRGFTPAEAAFWRTAIGCILFLFAGLPALRRLRLSTGEWLRLAAVGFFGYAFPLVVGNLGQHLSSATNASILIGVEPVSLILLSAVFLGEPLTLLKWGSVLCGFSGAALVVSQGRLPDFGSSTLRGDLLLFLHGFCWALYSVIGKPLLKKIEPLAFTAVTTVFALVPISLAAWPSMSAGRAEPVGGSAVGGIVYLAVVVTFLSTSLWNKALQRVPASVMANFIFLQPLVGVLFGVLVQGERFSAWSAAGGAMILLSVWGATRERA